MILWMHWLHWLETTSTAAPLSLPSSTKLWKPNNTFKKQIHLSLSLWMSRSPLNGHVDTARPHAEYRPTDSSTRRFARQTAHFVQCKITENHKTSTRLQWDSTLHPSRMTRCVFMVNHKNTMASLMTVWLKPTSLIGTQISLRLQKKMKLTLKMICRFTVQPQIYYKTEDDKAKCCCSNCCTKSL